MTHDWYINVRGMCWAVCGEVHIKENTSNKLCFSEHSLYVQCVASKYQLLCRYIASYSKYRFPSINRRCCILISTTSVP